MGQRSEGRLGVITRVDLRVRPRPAARRVEAVLSVDERGQMVLPKDIREKAGIKTSDKLALISWSRGGDVCCLALMKVGNLSGMVKDVLGPLMQESEKK